MDLLIKARNKVFYQVDSQLAAILIAAFPESFAPVERENIQPRAATLHVSQAENAQLGDPFAKEVAFDVFSAPISGQLAIRATCGRETQRFTGTPKAAETFKFWLGGSAWDIPLHVQREYAARYNPIAQEFSVPTKE